MRRTQALGFYTYGRIHDRRSSSASITNDTTGGLLPVAKTKRKYHYLVKINARHFWSCKVYVRLSCAFPEVTSLDTPTGSRFSYCPLACAVARASFFRHVQLFKRWNFLELITTPCAQLRASVVVPHLVTVAGIKLLTMVPVPNENRRRVASRAAFYVYREKQRRCIFIVYKK